MRSRVLLIAIFLVVLSPGFAQEPTWTLRLPATSPQFACFAAMTYDAARQRVVLFGGADPTCNFPSNETWIWDGFTWTRNFRATSPPARGAHVMAYDAGRKQVVLFGGAVGGTISADTWVWDGVNWTQRFPATSPSARLHAAMAYDESRQQVVLFGGGPGDPSALPDTWVWDGANWTQRFPPVSPPARGGHAMDYDTVRGQIVLFGGTVDGVTVFFNDTWVWDGTTWAQRFPTTSPTTPRLFGRMAYDTARQRVVLFGGQGPNNNPLYNDTWVWDGTNWAQRFPATSPPGRTGHTMAYDAARSQVVMFGGFTGAQASSDTWVWGTPLVVVQIDIRPGTFPNSIDLSARGTVPVAILTTPAFDATTVNASTVRFAGAVAVRKVLRDVDGDGDLDMVLDFGTQSLSLTCASTQAPLTGQTTPGAPIEGADSVRIVRDKNGQACP